MQGEHIIIVGAGIGGLAAAMVLAAQGLQVTVFEKEAAPGGKMREIAIGGHRVDSGPTVLTMRDVFDGLFADAGTSLSDHVQAEPASVLARHAWDGGGALDLYSDMERSVEAIGDFAGAENAKGYRDFCREAREIYRVLDRSFIRAQKPSLPELMWRIGPHRIRDLLLINPYESLWKAVSRRMSDPRLRQLFARYATYCGSSPFLAPATLSLVAHVEQQGVWLVQGGMHKLALGMMKAAEACGAAFRFGAPVAEALLRNGKASGVRLTNGEQIQADAVVINADSSAAATGLLGAALRGKVSRISDRARSLSALTWSMAVEASGFKLARHTVFFSKSNYASEFEAIFKRGALPEDPTVYVCAQDRDSGGDRVQAGQERLLLVVNAPACRPNRNNLNQPEIEQCEKKVFALMERCGLTLHWSQGQAVRTAPQDFAKLFPGSHGAIYGRASHGWMASFRRQSAHCRIPGLYFAGGSVHPGPGVPMAALSGRLAAEALLTALASRRRFHPAATPGGILMPSAATGGTD